MPQQQLPGKNQFITITMQVSVGRLIIQELVTMVMVTRITVAIIQIMIVEGIMIGAHFYYLAEIFWPIIPIDN